MSNRFSRKVTTFHDRTLPEKGVLAGYAILLYILEEDTGRRLPLPNTLALVTNKQQRYNTDQWQVFANRYMPAKNEIAHLTFALKYEGIDLLILKEFFLYTGNTLVKTMMKN